MKNNLSIEDLVSRYLDREMTDTELVDFERKLEVDPAIREELAFQKDIITSIKEIRRIELKSRLSNLRPPSAPLLHTVGIKIAAIASITAIVGTGAYFLLSQNDADFRAVELSQQPAETSVNSKPVPPVPEIQIPSEEHFIPEDGTVAEGKERTKEKSPAPIKEEKKAAEKPAVTPEVVRPDIAQITEEQEPETGEMVEEENYNNMDEITESVSGQLAVEIEKNRKFRFHYKFYNEKLYLLGDFKDSPYEIIELNSRNGTKYFLYYEGNYYRLSPDRLKPTPLEQLTDEKLVDELQIIQQNK